MRARWRVLCLAGVRYENESACFSFRLFFHLFKLFLRRFGKEIRANVGGTKRS